MTIPVAAEPFSDSMFALTLALLLLAPLAIAGVALVNTGLGRSRSAAQSLLGCAAILSVAAIVFAVVGAALAGSHGASAHTLMVAGKPWNWIGTAPLLLRQFSASPPQAQLGVLFEFLAVALAAIIPWDQAPIAGASPRAVRRQRFWPRWFFRCWRIGSGRMDGWRRRASTSGWARVLLTAPVRRRLTHWADSARWR